MSSTDTLCFAPLDLAQLPQMLQVEQSAHPYPWREALLRDALVGQSHLAIGLWAGGELVGFYLADWVLDESTLHNICLLPACRGRRWGEALLKHYLQQTAALGISHWWLEVRRSNLVAQSLYLRAGYQQVGVRKGYYACQDGREDALVMACHRTD